MGIRGAKPSISKALVEKPVYVPTGIINGVERPADLTPPAVCIWDILIQDLTEMGVFRPADALILVEICEMLAESKILRHKMQNPPKDWFRFEPDLSLEEKNDFADNPELYEDHLREVWHLSNTYKRLRVSYLQTMRQMKSFMDEFGLSPVARLRLGLLQLQGASLLDAFGGDDDDAPPPRPEDEPIEAEVLEDGRFPREI